MLDANAMNDAMPLEGNKVKLRTFVRGDITHEYLGWLNDPEIVRYSNQRFSMHSKQSSLEYLDSFSTVNGIFVAIVDSVSGEMLGTMTVYLNEHHETADIGILIGNQAVWGKGIGRDAWGTMLSFLLNFGETRKVTGGTLACNHGMVRIMKNTGMQPDGVRSKQEVVEGEAQDIVYYAKFREQ